METGALDEHEELRPQPQKKRKKKKRRLRQTIKKDLAITIEMLENYCMSRTTWEEAKPFVDLLEKIYGLCPPSRVSEAIEKVTKKFNEKIYGKSIQVKNMVMKQPYIKGPFNSFRNNKKVEVGKYGER